MNKYYDPKLSLEILQTYQGYSLQVFTSGRIKLSFHISHIQRVGYYAKRPKLFHEAYAKQRHRSSQGFPKHFALVDRIFETSPNTLIHRIHLKADNNATADRAHVLTDISNDRCHVILNTLCHHWDLPKNVVQTLHLRGGPKRGTASIFNEYMPSYEHDWEDARFTLKDYQYGYREQHNTRGIADQNEDRFDF